MSTKILGQDIQTQKYTTAGGTTAYTATVPNLTALYDGFAITVKMNATNTGSSTLNVNGLGAKTIKKPGVTNMAANDLLINSVYTFVYDLSQDFFFLPSLTTTTSTGGFGGGATSAYGLVDYVFADANAGSQNFDNHYGLYESASAIYSFSFCAMGNGASNDDASGLASILKIDKTTGENTLYRSTTFCVVNGSGASPDAYITENAGVINFGWTSSTSNGYISFDTSTDTFGGYGATTSPACSVVLIGSTSVSGIPQNTRLTAGLAPGTTPPIALSYGGYEYSFQQYTTVETFGSSTAGSAITFLTRTGSIYEYNNIGIEVNSPANTLIRGFFMKDDGTAFYIQNAFSGTVQQYTLGTPWDLSTYSFLNSQTATRFGMYRGNSGQYQYSVWGQGTDRVYRMTASTPWLLSSLGSSQNYNPTAQCADVSGVWLNDTGTKMYLLSGVVGTGFGGTNQLYQYSLSTPRQISSGVTYDTVSFDFSSQDSSIQAVAFSTDGTKMFACGASTQTIYQYELGTAWDVSTATYGGNAFRNVGGASIVGLGIRPDMSYVYLANNTNTGITSIFNILEYIQI